MLKEFKEFALKGNAVDMAIGLIIGAGFGAIVKSLVDDILMPPLGLLAGQLNFSDFFILLQAGKTPPPYVSLAEAKAAGAVSINYGLFLNSLLSFAIVAFTVFLMVRAINRLKRQTEPPIKAAPTPKACPYCRSTIAADASRCAFCTSALEPSEKRTS